MSLVSEIEADIQIGQDEEDENNDSKTKDRSISPQNKHNLDINEPIIPIEIPVVPKKGVKRGRPPLSALGKRFRANSRIKPVKPSEFS